MRGVEKKATPETKSVAVYLRDFTAYRASPHSPLASSLWQPSLKFHSHLWLGQNVPSHSVLQIHPAPSLYPRTPTEEGQWGSRKSQKAASGALWHRLSLQAYLQKHPLSITKFFNVGRWVGENGNQNSMQHESCLIWRSEFLKIIIYHSLHECQLPTKYITRPYVCSLYKSFLIRNIKIHKNINIPPSNIHTLGFLGKDHYYNSDFLSLYTFLTR